jgi:hypothetical protein
MSMTLPLPDGRAVVATRLHDSDHIRVRLVGGS